MARSALLLAYGSKPADVRVASKDCCKYARGDEMAPELSTEAARREWLTRALEQEQSGEGQEDAPVDDESDDPLEGFDAERILARVQGRAGSNVVPVQFATVAGER